MFPRLLLCSLLSLAARPALAQGPALDLPDDDEYQRALTRGTTDERLEQPGTSVGGYGQLNATWRKIGPDAPPEGSASVRRLVVFLTHQFDERFRMNAELEWENAIACSTCQGSVEVEQVYVDWRLMGDTLGLRAGLILVPMGIINQWHEPSVFHGVDRPVVDEVIIPTTWRELGVGVFGRQGALRYELYVVTAPDPLLVSREGFAAARGLGEVAKADGPAITGRIEHEPVLGLVVGASGIAGEMGPNALYYDGNGKRVRLTLPIYGWSADARYRQRGWEARVVWAQFHLPESGALLKASKEDGSPIIPDPVGSGVPPTRLEGGYVEVAYDVLRLLTTTDHQLLPFVRLEMANTQAAVPAGHRTDPRFDMRLATYGLTYRPIPQVVFKGDLQIRDRLSGEDEWLANAGVGFMF